MLLIIKRFVINLCYNIFIPVHAGYFEAVCRGTRFKEPHSADISYLKKQAKTVEHKVSRNYHEAN